MFNDYRYWDIQLDNSFVILMFWQCSYFVIFIFVFLYGGGEFLQFYYRFGIVYGDRNMCMFCVLFGLSVIFGFVFVYLQFK